MSDFAKDYAYDINILLGANCENSNIDFDLVNYLFLNSRYYSVYSLREAGVFKNLSNIPDINLSNNNFYGQEWNLNEFLKVLFKKLELYRSDRFYEQRKSITELIEEEYSIYGSAMSDTMEYESIIDREIIDIIKKLIPNLSNTKLKIKFNIPEMGSFAYLATDIIVEVLSSGKFNGCYVEGILTGKEYIECENDKCYSVSDGIYIDGRKLYGQKNINFSENSEKVDSSLHYSHQGLAKLIKKLKFHNLTDNK